MRNRSAARVFDSRVLGMTLSHFVVLVVSAVLLVGCTALFSISSAGVVTRLYGLEVKPLFPNGLGCFEGDSILEEGSEEEAPAEAGNGESPSGQGSVLTIVSEPLASVRDAVESAASKEPSNVEQNHPASEPSSPTDAPNTSPAPSEPAETGPSEEEEQAYLEHLRSCYDALPGLYSEINAGWNSFRSEALASTESTRAEKWSQYQNLFNRTAQAEVRFADVEMPHGSRYGKERQRIQELYTDLGNASALLAQSWGRCYTDFEDESVWMAPFNQNSSGGRIIYLLDYESKIQGARP